MKKSPIGMPFYYNNCYYYYDTYTNKMFSIKKEHFMEIKKLMNMGTDKYVSDDNNTVFKNDIIRLINRGFFTPQFLSEKKCFDSVSVHSMLTRCVNHIQLQTTRMCNFRCRYCFFANDNKVTRNHENKNMDWATAQKSIDFLFDNSKDAETITISFYGGEPFLNFDVIKRTVTYAKSKFISKELRFSVTTNGSVMNDAIADFLADNDFSLLISLDGPKNIQDNHRKFNITGQGTFDTVIKNVQLLKQRHSEYFNRKVMFNPVMFADESYQNVVDFFNSIGVNCNNVKKQYANMKGIDYNYNFTDSEFINMTKYDRYREYNSDQIENMEKVFKQTGIISTEYLPQGGCVPGLIRVFVTVDGDFYPCEKVNETPDLCIGNISQGFDFGQVERLANIGNLTYDKCKQCWAVRFCNMCIIHCTDAETGDISCRARSAFCDVTKQMAKAYLEKQAEIHTRMQTTGDQ